MFHYQLSIQHSFQLFSLIINYIVMPLLCYNFNVDCRYFSKLWIGIFFSCNVSLQTVTISVFRLTVVSAVFVTNHGQLSSLSFCFNFTAYCIFFLNYHMLTVSFHFKPKTENFLCLIDETLLLISAWIHFFNFCFFFREIWWIF